MDFGASTAKPCKSCVNQHVYIDLNQKKIESDLWMDIYHITYSGDYIQIGRKMPRIDQKTEARRNAINHNRSKVYVFKVVN